MMLLREFVDRGKVGIYGAEGLFRGREEEMTEKKRLT